MWFENALPNIRGIFGTSPVLLFLSSLLWGLICLCAVPEAHWPEEDPVSGIWHDDHLCLSAIWSFGRDQTVRWVLCSRPQSCILFSLNTAVCHREHNGEEKHGCGCTVTGKWIHMFILIFWRVVRKSLLVECYLFFFWSLTPKHKLCYITIHWIP